MEKENAFGRSAKTLRSPPKTTNQNNESMYPCEICTVIDNRSIVCCDGCNLWFHFECVNAPSDVANFDWFCVLCRQIDRSSGQVHDSNARQNLNVTIRQEPANTSTDPLVFEQIVPTSTLVTNASHQPISPQQNVLESQQSMKDAPNNTNKSRKAKSTSTSSTRRKTLALQRLEEERTMEKEEQARRERLNKEYLDKKYSIMEQQSSEDEHLNFNDEEIIRLSRIDSVNRWAEDARVQTQAQTRTTETAMNVRSNEKRVVPSIRGDLIEMESGWFSEKFGDVPENRAQHESSPVNRQTNLENEVYVPVNSMANQESSVHESRSSNDQMNNQTSIANVQSEPIDQVMSCDMNRTRMGNQAANLSQNIRDRLGDVNRIRRRFGFADFPVEMYGVNLYQTPQNGAEPYNERQTVMCGQPPYSAANKTSIHRQTAKPSQPVLMGHNQTFITSTQSDATLNQYNNESSRPPVMSTSVYQSRSEHQPIISDPQPLVSINQPPLVPIYHQLSQTNATYFQPNVSDHQSTVLNPQPIVSVNQPRSSHQRPLFSNFQPPQVPIYQQTNETNFHHPTYSNQRQPIYSNPHQPTFSNVHQTNASNHNQFQSLGSTVAPNITYSHGQPVITSMPPVTSQMFNSNHRTNDSQFDSIGLANRNDSLRQDGLMTMQNIMSRQVIDKKLQNFNGDPLEWNRWYNRYKSTTDKCNLDNSENLDRLTKCLKDKAYDMVKSKLGQTEAVPWIISTLQKVFGRPEVVLKAVMNRIREIQPLKNDNLTSIMEFAFEVQSVSTAIEASGLTNQYSNPMLLEELVEKLPTIVKLDWARYKHQRQNITVKTFTDWLDVLADVISTVTEPVVVKNQFKKPEKRNEKEKAYVNVHMDGGIARKESNNSNDSSKGPKKPWICLTCGKGCQKLENCSKFKELTLDRKWQEVKEHKLCRLCLKRHRFPCKLTSACGKDGCSIKHHHLLHNDDKQSTTTSSTSASNNVHHESNGQIMLKYMPVVLRKNNKRVFTFAFFDDGSQASMLEQNLADELGVTGTKEELCLLWTDNIHRKEEAQRISIEISGLNYSECRFPLNGIRAVKSLHLPPQTFKKEDLIKKFPHLANVPMENYENAVPGILIASDFPKLGVQLEVVEGKDFNGPIAQKTRLGWAIYGPQGRQSESFHLNNHHVVEICTQHNQHDQNIHQKIKEYFSIENFGVRANSKTELESRDNQRAIDMLNKLTKMVEGRYETGLLWKQDSINETLPDSYPMAMKRLISMEKQGDAVVKAIGDKIDEYVAKGYARKLSLGEVKKLGQNVWYLPVFGVIHPKKPEKLRMVFDGAAKVKSVSLNSMLLTGPDELASLVDILRRLREKLFAIGADIKEMYHQVKVQKSDQQYQLFLFRNGDTSREPDVYIMAVMTFGSRCSPAAAQFVKNKNARKFEKTHPRAVEAIIDNHYVDDMMDGENTIKNAIKLAKDVQMIHASGGFEIRNFISNSPDVLKAMGSVNTCDGKELSLHSELKTERVLGMWWNTRLDVFTFSLKYTRIAKEILDGTKMPTKRELLRTLMSIFDPLGLLSNYLIQLKILLQDVWRLDLNWDDKITSENLVSKWKQWLGHLPLVENVQVPRMYSLKLVSEKSKTVEIHTFVDASVDAFSAVSYLRIVNEDGIDCALMGSKARVAPLKYLSIPRKELQSCVLGARLVNSIGEAQRFTIDRRVFWSDSETVLSWLKSDHRKYSQFIAHRVGEILDSSDVNEWRWIPTKENVADEATKWSKPMNFNSSNRWFSGPEFLRRDESEWPKKRIIKSNIEEEMKAHCVHESLVLPQLIDPNRFSKWNRIVRALAYSIRFRNVFIDKKSKGTPLSQNEITSAENHLFRQAQFEGFPSELVILVRNEFLPLSKKKFIEKPSPLYDGTPYVDRNQVMRMRSRIDGARDLSMNSKRPIILPRNSRITRLLVQHYHAKYYHQNHNTVINEIRQRFYIPRLRAVLKSVRYDCQMCKVRKAPIMEPQMADLPQARLATFIRPFSYVGVDYFGPMHVKIGKRVEKRWGVLFTCLTIRAVHIDMVPSLDANSCIIVIRNFIADRGQVKEFHSDCGTHFTGANNELTRELGKLDREKLLTEFTSSYTKWIFNPPASPHMGGSWERLIRSVKSGLYASLPTRTPKEETLRNVLKEIQNVVNSRPLTYIPLEVEEDEALTPNHFLHGSSNGMKPPCDIDVNGEYLRKSWKEAQRLTELFWKRFVKEYLPNIARRTKWHKQVKPITMNDLVLVVDEKNPRNVYPRARVLEAPIGSNGQVRRAKIELIAEAKIGPSGKICRVRKHSIWRPAHKLAVLDVLFKPEASFAQPILDHKTGGRMLKTNVNTGPRRSARIAQNSGNTRKN